MGKAGVFIAFLFPLLAFSEGSDTIPLKPNAESKSQSDLPPKPFLASLETYGSSRINAEILRKLLGKQLDVWIEKGLKSDSSALELEPKLTNIIKEKFGFPIVEWSIFQYPEPESYPIHITLDVVEAADMSRRAPFAASPTQEIPDPGGLIKQWFEYEDQGLDLVESGAIEPDDEDCPTALHCPFGHKHEKLKKYEKIFTQGVARYQKELVRVLENDKRAEHRAAAAFLLAYQKEGKKLVGLMVGRLKDPDSIVRNNALRVLGEIAELHDQFVIPLKSVLAALEYPRVSDRSKAIYVVYHMALNSQAVRSTILETSGVASTLLQMLASTQPDHKELSHLLLRKISGKDIPSTDIKAWTDWSKEKKP